VLNSYIRELRTMEAEIKNSMNSGKYCQLSAGESGKGWKRFLTIQNSDHIWRELVEQVEQADSS